MEINGLEMEKQAFSGRRFYHEGREGHEVLEKPTCLVFFVPFVSFVVKDSFQK
jgi:hypothetical protein